MSRDVIIETRNLSKVYRDFWGRPKVQALKALDLQVHKGEIFGVLGPNGSGKTTTIKLLLGLLFPTEGDAFIFGEPTTNVAKNERIGYLPEESYLYKFLNAEETLHFYGRLFKISKAERTKRVGRLIDMVGLNAAKHRQLREYSKGMQRRIGLAQALINNPELILLDEPTSGLDPIGTAEIKELIRDLKTQGKTVVLSGHLLADMQDICDRIAILHRGELKELGKVSDLLTVQDVTQIKTKDLPAAAIEEIRAVIKRHGAQLLAVDHPTTTLEELFLRIVRESDLHPGRRRVGDKPADAHGPKLGRIRSPTSSPRTLRQVRPTPLRSAVNRVGVEIFCPSAGGRSQVGSTSALFTDPDPIDPIGHHPSPTTPERIRGRSSSFIPRPAGSVIAA